MGFAQLQGLLMATRAGSVDPGLVLWLLQHGRLSLGAMADEHEHDAGLTGLADGSGDMRDIVAASGDFDISTDASPARTVVVTSREDLEIARLVRETIQ